MLSPLMENGPRLAVTAYSSRSFMGHSPGLGHVGACARALAASSSSNAAIARCAQRPLLSAFICAFQQVLRPVVAAIGEAQLDWQIASRWRKPHFDPCFHRR